LHGGSIGVFFGVDGALAEATADIKARRVYSADEFLKKVEEKWPTKEMFDFRAFATTRKA
jgi:hypothetical protein